MSSVNFIPRSDAEFDLWQENLLELIEPSLTAWGILTDDFTALKTSQTAWVTAIDKASNKQNRTSADVQAKDDAREAYEQALRIFIAQWLAYNTSVTDSDRERMGLTVNQVHIRRYQHR